MCEFYHSQGELEMVGMELRHRDGQEIGTVSREDSSSLHHSSIIAQSSRSTETQMSGSRSQRGGNVVLTSSSYRYTFCHRHYRGLGKIYS